MSLPTTPELIASLDEELVDLLSERMKLVALLSATKTPEEIEQQVQRMRNLAATYRVSPDLVEKIARALIEAGG